MTECGKGHAEPYYTLTMLAAKRGKGSRLRRGGAKREVVRLQLGVFCLACLEREFPLLAGRIRAGMSRYE